MNKGNDLSLKKLRGSQSKKSLPLASQVQKKYIFLLTFVSKSELKSSNLIDLVFLKCKISAVGDEALYRPNYITNLVIMPIIFWYFINEGARSNDR